MSWQTVLGFEIHIELATASKMFCGCPADHFGKAPNTQTCPVCLGLPGALPVPNQKAIEWCLKLGLALNCQINYLSKFDRKNYFYPDLPKGYQISQYDQPFCYGGYLKLASGKKVNITRVHLEEDTGKLQHRDVDGKKVSLIDFNRSGVPLVEIVTEPDFTNAQESLEFLKEIQLIVRSLKISGADMEKGSMRLEANISVKPSATPKLPAYKVEVKNVNSFRFVAKAIEYEIKRQIGILESGKIPAQETRGFDENRGVTFLQRSKEAAYEYRYFPEPDIPPFTFPINYIEDIKKQINMLPSEKRKLLMTKYHLLAHNASLLSANDNMYTLFTQAVGQTEFTPKTVADIIINKKWGKNTPKTGEELLRIIKSQNQTLISDTEQLSHLAKVILENHPDAVADIKKGKTQAIYFLIGQMKKQLGNIDVDIARQVIEKLLRP